MVTYPIQRGDNVKTLRPVYLQIFSRTLSEPEKFKFPEQIMACRVRVGHNIESKFIWKCIGKINLFIPLDQKNSDLYDSFLDWC
jgi:hypothetical protein